MSTLKVSSGGGCCDFGVLVGTDTSTQKESINWNFMKLGWCLNKKKGIDVNSPTFSSQK